MKRLVIVSLTFVLFACSHSNWEVAESNEFSRAVAQPEWFARTDFEPINNYEEMSALWQGHDRSGSSNAVKKANRYFYKSCFVALYEKSDDPDLEPRCLVIMDNMLAAEDRVRLYQYLLKNYSNYDQRTDNCASCSPGDLIARATRDYARTEFYTTNRENPIAAYAMLETLLDRRLDDISEWVLGEIYEEMSQMLQRAELPYEKAVELDTRISDLLSYWTITDHLVWRIDALKESQAALRTAYQLPL